MKYFTPELYARGNSPDETVVAGIEEAWEQALRRYARRWRKIRDNFPEGVRRLDEDRVCLHDAELLHVVRQGQSLLLILETAAPAHNLVILTFTLADEFQFLTDALPEDVRGPRAYWLYEEFDLDRHKRCWFEVFFTNGWALKLCFTEFEFLIGRAIHPGANGRIVSDGDAGQERESHSRQTLAM
jgi:hypothetical protein